MGRLPWREAILAGGAGATLGVWALAPPARALPSDLHPLTLTHLTAWTLWRLAWLYRAWHIQTRWHRAVAWQLSAARLPLEDARPRVPRLLRAWLLHRAWLRDPGFFLGQAFRWNARYTQVLELALAQDGALPVAEDARGGHPALHAVGRRSERPLVLPWSAWP